MTITVSTSGRHVTPPLSPSIAIHAAGSGTALLVYRRDHRDLIDVEAIVRLPAGLDPIVAWLEANLARRQAVILDADGLGQALADRLQIRRRRGWSLYAKHGRERQEIVNKLLVATSEKRIHIRQSPHAEAMRKALASYRREVADDGLIGSELVVALGLTLVGPRPGRRLGIY